MKPLRFPMLGIVFCALTGLSAERSPSASLRAGNDWKSAEALFQTLEKNFSSIQSVQTGFTEEKKLKIFDSTVRIEGRLALESSGRLAWRVDEPIQYVLILKDDAAFQWDEETRRVQRLPFSGNPVFETVIAQIQCWFSGRFAALESDYDLQVLSETPPRLVFTPREDRMVAKAIRQVTVSIRDDQRYVEKIVIDDVSGDQTSIVFHDTVLNAPLAADCWEVVPREQ